MPRSSGRHAGSFGAEPELVAQRGLHAIAVENLAFDFRGLDRLVADQLDPEGFPVVGADMLAGADEFAGLPQKLLLKRL